MTEYSYTIAQDLDAPNPRKDFDHVGKLDIGSRGNRKDFAETTYNRDDREVFAVLPVYRYEHSDVAYNTTGFSCPWDSGQVGWIVAYRGAVLETWGFKRRTKKAMKTVLACLVAEIEELSQWCNGDVYGYQITDDNGDIVDSCCGYFGHDTAEQAAKDAIAYLADKATHRN